MGYRVLWEHWVAGSIPVDPIVIVVDPGNNKISLIVSMELKTIQLRQFQKLFDISPLNFSQRKYNKKS